MTSTDAKGQQPVIQQGQDGAFGNLYEQIESAIALINDALEGIPHEAIPSALADRWARIQVMHMGSGEDSWQDMVNVARGYFNRYAKKEGGR